MAIQERTRTKVTALLNIVYEKCKEGKEFSMPEIIKFLNADGTLPHHLITHGIIENGGGYGKDGKCPYKWTAPSSPNEKLVNYLLEEIEAYRRQATERRKQKMNPKPQLMLPAPEILLEPEYETQDEEIPIGANIESPVTFVHTKDMEALWSEVQELKAYVKESNDLLHSVAHRLGLVWDHTDFLFNQFNK